MTFVDIEFTVLQDLTKPAKAQIGTVVDTGSDTTAPTIAMTTPATGGTVTKDAKGTILLTITEANAMDESSIVYGDTVKVLNTTSGKQGLVAGTIAYDATAKTITFTPTNNWTASETGIVVVSTGMRDANGNNLAATFVGTFSVTA
jgi:predicted RecA/RadA family phage recombinase